jgi:hypothetical protein
MSARDAYQRRGRAALLGAGAVVVLAQCVAGLWLDRHGLAVRFPEAARVLANAPHDGRGADVVFLGSSRFIPLNAPEATALLRREHPDAGPAAVYNAAVTAGDPIAQDYVLERLLRQGTRPRLAVIEVSPDTVNAFNEWMGMHVYRQLTWADMPAYFLDVCRSGELRKVMATRLAPLYAHRYGLLREAAATVTRPAPAPLPVPDGRPPWESLAQRPCPPLNPAEREAHAAAGRLAARRFRNYRVGGTTAAALERLLARCRSNGIEVVLVGVPNDSAYVRNYTPAIDAAYSDYVGRLTRDYQCRFLDYRAAVPDDFFADVCHVNPYGADYFTRKLTREIIAPWWERHAAGGFAGAGTDSVSGTR